MKLSVERAYARQADWLAREENGPEQWGAYKDKELAKRLFARVRRHGRFMRSGDNRPYQVHSWRRDRWGKMRSLSRLQTQVLDYVERLPKGARFTQTMMANSLGVSPSSISRALTMLEAFGLAWTDRHRGRYGGTTIAKPPASTWKLRAKAAWRKIKHAQAERNRRWIEWLVDHNQAPLFLRERELLAWRLGLLT